MKIFQKIQKLQKRSSSCYNEDMEPEIGDELYIQGSFSIDHGWDDVEGGLGVICRIQQQTSAGKPTYFVEVQEIPGRFFNWGWLQEKQELLQKAYRMRRARPDPDFPDSWGIEQRVEWFTEMYGENLAAQYFSTDGDCDEKLRS